MIRMPKFSAWRTIIRYQYTVAVCRLECAILCIKAWIPGHYLVNGDLKLVGIVRACAEISGHVQHVVCTYTQSLHRIDCCIVWLAVYFTISFGSRCMGQCICRTNSPCCSCGCGLGEDGCCRSLCPSRVSTDVAYRFHAVSVVDPEISTIWPNLWVEKEEFVGANSFGEGDCCTVVICPNLGILVSSINSLWRLRNWCPYRIPLGAILIRRWHAIRGHGYSRSYGCGHRGRCGWSPVICRSIWNKIYVSEVQKVREKI